MFLLKNKKKYGENKTCFYRKPGGCFGSRLVSGKYHGRKNEWRQFGVSKTPLVHPYNPSKVVLKQKTRNFALLENSLAARLRTKKVVEGKR